MGNPSPPSPTQTPTPPWWAFPLASPPRAIPRPTAPGSFTATAWWGAGRDEGADTGGGKELYAVIGQSPRNLDRNVTLVGRVIDGIERLSVLPRGTGDLGFYKTDAEKTSILRIRLAADLPAAERTPFEALRTESHTFAALVQSRRYRKDSWYLYSPGRIGVCNTPLPVRVAKP